MTMPEQDEPRERRLESLFTRMEYVEKEVTRIDLEVAGRNSVLELRLESVAEGQKEAMSILEKIKSQFHSFLIWTIGILIAIVVGLGGGVIALIAYIYLSQLGP